MVGAGEWVVRRAPMFALSERDTATVVAWPYNFRTWFDWKQRMSAACDRGSRDSRYFGVVEIKRPTTVGLGWELQANDGHRYRGSEAGPEFQWAGSMR